MNKPFKLRHSACTALLLLAFAVTATAAPLRAYTVTGTVSNVAGNPFGLGIALGDAVTGTLTYDAGVIVTSAPGDTLLFYPQNLSDGLLANVGGSVFTSNNFSFLVENDRPVENLDGYNVTSAFGGDLFRDAAPATGSIGIAALGPDSTIDSLSLLDFDPLAFAGSTLQLLQDGDNYLQASITLAPTAVPVPASILMLATGLAGLLSYRARSRLRSS